MSAPRVFYMDLNPKGVKGDVTEPVQKSDYDELQAKLTESQRLNTVALEAMKEAQRVSHKVVGLKLKVLNNAIKELEALK